MFCLIAKASCLGQLYHVQLCGCECAIHLSARSIPKCWGPGELTVRRDASLGICCFCHCIVDANWPISYNCEMLYKHSSSRIGDIHPRPISYNCQMLHRNVHPPKYLFRKWNRTKHWTFNGLSNQYAATFIFKNFNAEVIRWKIKVTMLCQTAMISTAVIFLPVIRDLMLWEIRCLLFSLNARSYLYMMSSYTETDNEPKSAVEGWKQFSQDVTMHGMRYVHLKDTTLLRRSECNLEFLTLI